MEWLNVLSVAAPGLAVLSVAAALASLVSARSAARESARAAERALRAAAQARYAIKSRDVHGGELRDSEETGVSPEFLIMFERLRDDLTSLPTTPTKAEPSVDRKEKDTGD